MNFVIGIVLLFIILLLVIDYKLVSHVEKLEEEVRYLKTLR